MSIEQEQFIGRDKEINFFKQWLPAVNATPVIYIHDFTAEKESRGGIGKTWLLRKYYELTEQTNPTIIPVFFDFFNVTDRDGVVIAERIVQAIQAKYEYFSFKSFFKSLAEYHELAHGKKTEITNLREQLGLAFVDELRILDERPDANISLLLFFDTFEVIERNPITAVLHPARPFPDLYQSTHVHAIIAGRNPLDWQHPNWVGRKNEVDARLLPPFNQEEMKRYLETHLYTYDLADLSPVALHALHERTQGRPIMVGLVTDVLNKQIKDLPDLIALNKSAFEASLVAEINNFSDPSKVIIFSMAHIYHRFDENFLRHLMNWPGLKEFVPEINYQKLVQELVLLSFVRRFGFDSSNDFVLHDEMRRLVNLYCWQRQDPQGEIRRELSLMAIHYYQELIDQESNEEKQQSYIVERLYHELFLDSEDGFQSFEQHFNHALEFSLRTFARALFQELHDFEYRLSHEQNQAMKLAEVRLLLEEEKPQEALAVIAVLEQDLEWVTHHRYDLFNFKGICYRRLDDYEQAITYWRYALEVAQASDNQSHYAALLSRLGFVHRLQGRYAEAMTFYEEALKVQRNLDNLQEYANLLNNMGNVLRLQGGKLEEALRFCKLALRIRRDLFKQNKMSEAFIAMSQNTLGHIYHTLGVLDEEEKAYREAFEIYSRLGDRSALAHTHNNLGRMLVKKGDFQGALAEFKQAARIAAGGDHVAEVESSNQQGRMFLRQEKWEEARSFFEYAIELSRQFHLRFSLAENLLYLAETLDYLAQPSDALVKEAKHIARENDYSYLLARAGDIQGDMDFRKGEYQSAFRRYKSHVAIWRSVVRQSLTEHCAS